MGCQYVALSISIFIHSFPGMRVNNLKKARLNVIYLILACYHVFNSYYLLPANER